MPAGGAVINTSSIQADNPSPELLPYAATKAAIQNFTGGLAQMLGKRGIRVNCVAPGPVWTPLIPATMPPEKVKSFGKDVALGRPGQPAELAPVYVLLASGEASYVAGVGGAGVVGGGEGRGDRRQAAHLTPAARPRSPTPGSGAGVLTPAEAAF